MKKLIAITGSILISCLIFTSVILPGLPKASADEPEKSELIQESSSQISVPAEKTEKEGYILSEYKGCIAVYRASGGEMIYESDVSISRLPPKDRQMLEKGLYVKDQKELNRLLEDYCS